MLDNKFDAIVAKTGRNGNDFQGVITSGVLQDFRIKSLEDETIYTVSSPIKTAQGENGTTITFEVKAKLEPLTEEDLVTALIEHIAVANAGLLLATVGKQAMAVSKDPLVHIKVLGIENLSKQLLAVPKSINSNPVYADRILLETVHKINDQKEKKIADLTTKHVNEYDFDEANFRKTFNEILPIATNQYLGSYIHQTTSTKDTETVSTELSSINQNRAENRDLSGN